MPPADHPSAFEAEVDASDAREEGPECEGPNPHGVKVDPARSRNMSRIRSRDSKAELALRRALYALGFRYRLHVAGLPGKPDIVFVRAKVAVFMDGDFWHGRFWARDGKAPKTRRRWWIRKLTRNIERDRAVNRTLRKSGWKVVRVWESEIRRDARTVAERIVKFLSEPV